MSFTWHTDDSAATGTEDAVVTVVVVLHLNDPKVGAAGVCFKGGAATRQSFEQVLVQYPSVPGGALMFPSATEHRTENAPGKGAVKLTFFLARPKPKRAEGSGYGLRSTSSKN
eukprot:COSAG01_NODE_4736_length_4783_cov_24.168019_9_plen_113_part_00